MSTEVLLMTNVEGLGSEGDVVSVADGHARNYLFPQRLGAPVTEATRQQLERVRQKREAVRKAELDTAEEIARKLKTVSCTITVKTGPDEKIYGSVTSADIVEALKEQNMEVDKHRILLDQPIKELGIYNVRVKLHAEVETAVKVWVVEE